VLVIFALTTVGITFYPSRVQAKYSTDVVFELIDLFIDFYGDLTSHDFNDPVWVLEHPDCTTSITCPDGHIAEAHGNRQVCRYVKLGGYACTPEPCNASQPQC